MNESELQPVLVAGRWQASRSPVSSFQAENPTTGEALPEQYPVSSQAEVIAAVEAGAEAAQQLVSVSADTIAAYLERFAELIEAERDALVEIAQLETALPAEPRLNSVELPRTTGQLRQAAKAARERSWTAPVIDTSTDIRALYGPLGGPVAVFGPNNFPFAFNGASGGDFAAALAARNPVIAKANPGHPGTTRLLAKLAHQALEDTGLPPASVQMLYRMPAEAGLTLVSHPLVAATAFTGSKSAGLKLKAAADQAGKLIYLEMSSINPIFILGGALEERLDAIADELTASCTLGAGQFCTNPGFVVLPAGDLADAFTSAMSQRLEAKAPGVLLGKGVGQGLQEAVQTLQDAGATLVTGGQLLDGPGYRFANTLLTVSGSQFLDNPDALQTEAFGLVSLLVLADSEAQMAQIAQQLEGNLTGTFYSHTQGQDDAQYKRLEPILRRKVGRLLNDKMPTGVAVSPAMTHGGPYPATSHPGFTAVGMPDTIRRFAARHCYDQVREHLLPPELQDANPTGTLWRNVDGVWTQQDVQQQR